MLIQCQNQRTLFNTLAEHLHRQRLPHCVRRQAALCHLHRQSWMCWLAACRCRCTSPTRENYLVKFLAVCIAWDQRVDHQQRTQASQAEFTPSNSWQITQHPKFKCSPLCGMACRRGRKQLLQLRHERCAYRRCPLTRCDALRQTAERAGRRCLSAGRCPAPCRELTVAGLTPAAAGCAALLPEPRRLRQLPGQHGWPITPSQLPWPFAQQRQLQPACRLSAAAVAVASSWAATRRALQLLQLPGTLPAPLPASALRHAGWRSRPPREKQSVRLQGPAVPAASEHAARESAGPTHAAAAARCADSPASRAAKATMSVTEAAACRSTFSSWAVQVRRCCEDPDSRWESRGGRH